MAGFQWERDELSILKAKVDSGELISRAWGEKALPGRTQTAIRRMAVKLSSVSVDEFLAGRKEGTVKERPTGGLIPDASRPIDILLADRERDFERKAAHHLAKRDVKITMPDNGPYLAVGVGDVHIDNPGCDIKRFRDDIDFINGTDRAYGFGVGDWSDNWSGYLERLYAASPSTKSEAEKLMKWSLTCIDWLFVIFGNHDCHDVETEALTRRGWMRHDQIRADDEILAVDPQSGAAQWEPITGFIRKRCTGEMVSVESKHCSLLMTPRHRVLKSQRDSRDHRLWHEWEYSAAGELAGRFRMPSAGIVEPDIEPGIEDDWIRLAGWVLTDCGYAPDGRVTFYQSKDGSEIERLLESLGLEHKKTVRQRDITHVCGKKLKNPPLPSAEWRLTSHASESVRKVIPTRDSLPAWAHSLSSRQFDLLLNAIVAGDGTWYDRHPGSPPTCVIHKKKPVLDQIQAVAVRHGWRAMLSVHRENEWRLNLAKKPHVSVDAKTSVKSEYYDGIVWCLTVPSGNFMVRRNGKALFSGNCWSDSAESFCKERGIVGVRHGGIFNLVSGEYNTKINCRHMHRGNSQYDPAFAAKKQAYRGNPADLIISGHYHTSASGIIANGVAGTLSHTVRVGAYKVFDDYQEANGFDDDTIGPASFHVVRPYIVGPGKLTTFWDRDTAEMLLHAAVDEWEQIKEEL